MRIEFEVSIEIAATAERIWRVTADIERWPEWDPVVTAVKRLDHTPLGVGSRARIHQPKLLPAVWRITRFEAPKLFTWENQAPGARTVAAHLIDVKQTNPPICIVQLKVTQTGLLVALLRPILAKFLFRYVRMEAQGLKAHCEQQIS